MAHRHGCHFHENWEMLREKLQAGTYFSGTANSQRGMRTKPAANNVRTDELLKYLHKKLEIGQVLGMER